MKKLYSKPEIMFEDFTLSENIAGDCERKVGNPSKDQCAYESTGGITTFTATLTGCDFTPSDGMADGFCYHIPDADHNLFNS